MLQSPPSRRRGLKSRTDCLSRQWLRSPPSRRRGLKLQYRNKAIPHIHVASFSEAWIEIFPLYLLRMGKRVASFSEAWIEIFAHHETNAWHQGRLLLGGVD